MVVFEYVDRYGGVAIGATELFIGLDGSLLGYHNTTLLSVCAEKKPC